MKCYCIKDFINIDPLLSYEWSGVIFHKGNIYDYSTWDVDQKAVVDIPSTNKVIIYSLVDLTEMRKLVFNFNDYFVDLSEHREDILNDIL